jgi:hypothetical protein
MQYLEQSGRTREKKNLYPNPEAKSEYASRS